MAAAGRPLAVLTGGLFGASLTFPVAAALHPPAAPGGLLGAADVAVVAGLFAAAVVLEARARPAVGPPDRDRAFRLYRGLSFGFLALLAVFLLAGDRVAWNILLPGLAWRAWLLVYVLPAWLAAWRRPGGDPDLTGPTGGSSLDGTSEQASG
jgi:hypothetical protein